MTPRRSVRAYLNPILRFLSPFAVLVSALPAATPGTGGLEAVPLASPSSSAGATRFTQLPPEQTGIVAQNPYADPSMWGERNMEYAVGELGTGVAIADYDNDGRPDLFLVSKTGPDRLFRNLGDWRFEDVTRRTGIASAEPAGSHEQVRTWKHGAAFADVNNDGWLDLYVCRFNTPNQLFINQGDGTFREEAQARGLALVDASGMGAFCDYDRDGWLDVYVHTNLLNVRTQPMGRRDHLFRNRGDGTFEDVTERAGIHGETQAHSATWWDFDEDGWPDLYVANDFAPADRLYRNLGDGTFSDVIHQAAPAMPYSGMGADIGDVNNDGRIDLLVADMAATTHEKDHRGMAIARELSREDADSATLTPQVLRNTLLLGTGTGHLLEAAHLAGLQATDWTWSVRFEDLDNDGRVDLHVTTGMDREYHNDDLRQRVLTADSESARVGVMKASPLLAEQNLAFRNLGDLRFVPMAREWGLDQEGVSFGSAFGDFDGDGDLDLVFANYDAPPTVLRNDGTDGHRVILALRGTSSNRFGVGAVARLETNEGVQVRQLVVARGSLSSSEPVLHFGLGSQTEIERLTIDWPSGRRQEFAQLAAGKRYTITEPNDAPVAATAPQAPPSQFVEESAAWAFSIPTPETFESEQQALLPTRFDRRGPALALADLNADGRTDVLLGGNGKQPARVFAGGEHFSLVGNLPPSRLDDGPLLVFEADGDGNVDVLQTRAGMTRPAGSAEYQPVLFRNRGDGSLEPAADALPRTSISAGAVVAADFDRDGRLDLFLGARLLPRKYPLPGRSVLLRNTGGRFEDVTETIAPGLAEVGLVSSAIWSDVDLDGWPDLVLALEWGGVKCFRNQNGRRLIDDSDRLGFAAAGTGWWTCVASADFNADGRPDFAVGNIGLNTPYRIPALLYSGNFASPNATLLVEAEAEEGRLYARRTLQSLAPHFPGLKRRYLKNDDFARASLADVVGAERLASARRFEATQFESGVFLSSGDGRHVFRALPRAAQIAPLQGLVAGDFDGDGRADLFAVQNSHAPLPATGRFTGGLSKLLRGDGNGGFSPVPPRESGLIVPGDAKALVVADLNADGWPDFLLTRNNSSTLAFRNRGLHGRHSLRVTLRGPPANPSGLGARLVLEAPDGLRQTAEIAGGSGYYSQSEAACYFGGDASATRTLRVFWPGGFTSNTVVPAGATRLAVSAPVDLPE